MKRYEIKMLIFAMVMLLFSCVQCVAQQTILVPGQEPTIQDAINVAANGDTILVSPGTYTENITFKGKAITVTSGAKAYTGATSTIIQSSGNGPVVTFDSGETSRSVLNGFTITGGIGNASKCTGGEGIYISASSPTISNNIISNNDSGISATGISSSPIIEGNDIKANHYSSVNFQSCSSVSDQSVAGVGIGMQLVNGPQIIGNTIEGNQAETQGGKSSSGAGITISGAQDILIVDNIIRNNEANTDAALQITSTATNKIELIQNLVYGNDDPANIFNSPAQTGQVFLGGSYTAGSGPSITEINNTIYGGGQELVEHYQASVIENNIFYNPTPAAGAGSFPGGLVCADPEAAQSPLTITNNDIYEANLDSSYDCPLGSANITSDPVLVSPSQDNYREQSLSPTIDGGDINAPEIPSADLDGTARTVCSTIDMGAYELLPVPPVSVASSANPTPGGSSITFTAHVVGNCNTPTGTITFLDNGNPIGTGILNASGTTTLTTSLLVVGKHDITAKYSGDFNFQPSTSDVLVQVITGDPTTTTLSISPNPATAFSPITFSSVVSSQYGTPTGSVSFVANGKTLATAALNSSGLAAVTMNTISAGNYTVVADYTADTRFQSSSSSTLDEVVDRANSVTTLTGSPNPAAATQSITLSANVRAASGKSIPTGSVSFTSDGALVGTGTINSSGIATVSTSTLTVGTHRVVATYSGSSNFNSSSASLTENIDLISTKLDLTASPNPANSGQTVTLNAQIQAAISGTLPFGNILFQDGTSEIGTAPINAQGLATFTTSSLSNGTHSLTATYVANAHFAGSTSSVINEVVQAYNFSISPSSTSISLPSGDYTILSVSVTPIGGFHGSVTLSCDGTPDHTQCVFPEGNTVSLNQGPQTVQLAINTSDVYGYGHLEANASSALSLGSQPQTWLALLLFPGFGIFGLSRQRRLRTIHGFIISLLMVGALLSIQGCGGKLPGETPPGTYHIELLGASKGTTQLQNSVNMTLIVTQPSGK